MEIKAIFEMLGVNMEVFAVVSGGVFLATEWLKNEFPTTFKGGWKTRVGAIAFSFLLSLRMVYPDWIQIITLTLAAWIAPGGVHGLLKQFRKVQ